VRRAASALHGESDWLPIAAAKLWFNKGGIIIGEAYRPDLKPKFAGKAPLLRYDGNDGSGHVLVFAGSGGYKTTGTVIPSALEWRSGLVCLDPSAEVFRLVHQARRALGHRVAALNPEDPNADSFNALDWIDISTDRALLDLQAVVGWLCGETPGERYDDYFKHAARALLGCLLADLVFDPAIPPERKTLLLLRQRVSRPIPELKELLEAIYAKGSSYGFGFPAQLAGNLKDITEKQFSGFYGEAGNATSWLAIPSLARLVCGQGFRTRNLLSGKLDVFINLPLKVLQSSPPAARVILGALLNAVYEARGQNNGRMLFLLDEVARHRTQVRHQSLPALPVHGPAHPELGSPRPPGLVRCRLLAALLPYSGLRSGRVSLEGLRRIYRPRRFGNRRFRFIMGWGPQHQIFPSVHQPAANRPPPHQARRGPAGHALRRTDRPHPERPAPPLRTRNLLPPPRDGRSHQSQ
jgi:hypothetical protein